MSSTGSVAIEMGRETRIRLIHRAGREKAVGKIQKNDSVNSVPLR